MKRLQLDTQAVRLDGTPYVQAFDGDGNPIYWTVRALLIDSIQSVAGLAMGQGLVLWNLGLRVVQCEGSAIDIEDADFEVLHAAYKHPQALPGAQNWYKANLGKALESAETVDLDKG